MKPPTLTILFLASLLSTDVDKAHAQGTVHFSNSSHDLNSPPDRLVRFDPLTVGTNPLYNPYGTNNAPVVNFGTSSYRAQLYYGSSTATESSLVPVSIAPAPFRSSTTTGEPGTWVAGQRTLFGFDNTVNLQVRVWDGAYASSWEDYLVLRQGLAGQSAVFAYTIPTDPVCGQFCFEMSNFNGFTIGVPEPPAVALALLCILAAVPRKILRTTSAPSQGGG